MSTKAVSSAYGEIKRMLLTYPESNPLRADIILQRYFGIFKALGTNIEYVILAYPETHQAIINTAVNAGLTPENIMLVPAEFSPVVAVRKLIERRPNNGWLAEVDSPQHSIWVQDAYCVLNDEQGVCTMLEPLAFTRYGDHFIAEQLSANTDIQIATTKYYIEGGNVLCGDNYALIGKDFLHASVEVSGESENEVTEGLKKELGVEQLIWVGFDDAVDFPLSIHQGKYQPIFHIDMFMTLAGKSLQGKELILVGDTRQAKSLLDQPPIPEVISDSFDKIAERLEAEQNLNCEVKRLPLDLWLDDDNNPQTGTFLTYNNCLIEVFDTNKNVYLPAYSSVSTSSVNRRKLDKEVERIFKEEGVGFGVTMMEGSYHELCKSGGSLHCITKTLRRE